MPSSTFLNEQGTLADLSKAFTIAVIIGSNSAIHSLSRKGGKGSNVQDDVGELMIIFFISSWVAGRKLTSGWGGGVC